MQTVTLSEAHENLMALVRGSNREGEPLITDADTPVAKFSPVPPPTTLRQLRLASVGVILRPFPLPQHDTMEDIAHACHQLV